MAANGTPPGSRFLINGEPTDNRLGVATRGVLRIRLRASGRAAHSAQPEQGESAIDKLIDALILLRSVPLPADPELGSTYYSIGLIEGGVAPNVISPHASAEVLFRTVGPAEEILSAIRPLHGLVTSEEILRVPEVRLRTVPGFDTAVFAFTTDVPFLARVGDAAVVRPWIDPRGAHGGGAPRDRAAEPRGRCLRAACHCLSGLGDVARAGKHNQGCCRNQLNRHALARRPLSGRRYNQRGGRRRAQPPE